MKPFFVLIGSFVVAAAVLWLLHRQFEWQLAGRIAMSAMLLFTSLGHFLFLEGMSLMLPAFVPGRKFLIVLTGLLEIAAAILLLIPKFSYGTGWFLICFFLLLLPANIYAAINEISYEKPEEKGPGTRYLLFRLPFQLLLIVWTMYVAILY